MPDARWVRNFKSRKGHHFTGFPAPILLDPPPFPAPSTFHHECQTISLPHKIQLSFVPNRGTKTKQRSSILTQDADKVIPTITLVFSVTELFSRNPIDKLERKRRIYYDRSLSHNTSNGSIDSKSLQELHDEIQYIIRYLGSRSSHHCIGEST